MGPTLSKHKHFQKLMKREACPSCRVTQTGISNWPGQFWDSKVGRRKRPNPAMVQKMWNFEVTEHQTVEHPWLPTMSHQFHISAVHKASEAQAAAYIK